MDSNALIVQHVLDRQAEIVQLRAELTRAQQERDAYEQEVERLRAVIASGDSEPQP